MHTLYFFFQAEDGRRDRDVTGVQTCALPIWAMPDCMREMEARGLRPAVLAAAQAKPFLGICIGLQMLVGSSDESGVRALAVLPCRVRRFPREAMRDAEGRRLKVPHMGWNQVRQQNAHALWSGIEDDT